jgi:hypothetical protein
MRAIFNELGAMAGSTDFLVDAEVNALATKFDLVSSLNAEHCKHETDFMLPALKAIVRLHILAKCRFAKNVFPGPPACTWEARRCILRRLNHEILLADIVIY